MLAKILLLTFYIQLEKTLSLVAHMSEEMKLKALESLKVILPDHSPSLGIRADTSQQVSVSDPESVCWISAVFDSFHL